MSCVCHTHTHTGLIDARHVHRHTEPDALLELIRLCASGGRSRGATGRREQENNASSLPVSLVLSGTGHVVVARRENSGLWTFFTDVAPFERLSLLALGAQGNEVQYAPPPPAHTRPHRCCLPAIITRQEAAPGGKIRDVCSVRNFLDIFPRRGVFACVCMCVRGRKRRDAYVPLCNANA